MSAIQGNRAHGSSDRGSPVKIGGKASTATPTAVSDGQRVDAYFDEFGRQHIVDAVASTSVGVPTNATTAAYSPSLIIKASSGILYGLTGYNSKASAQFIQLHNSATVPADAAVPVVILTVPASANFSIDFGKYGRYFSTGIAICNSSTGPTKTIGSADCWFDAQYI